MISGLQNISLPNLMKAFTKLRFLQYIWRMDISIFLLKTGLWIYQGGYIDDLVHYIAHCVIPQEGRFCLLKLSQCVSWSPQNITLSAI